MFDWEGCDVVSDLLVHWNSNRTEWGRRSALAVNVEADPQDRTRPNQDVSLLLPAGMSFHQIEPSRREIWLLR